MAGRVNKNPNDNDGDQTKKRRAAQAEEEARQVAEDEARYLYVTRAKMQQVRKAPRPPLPRHRIITIRTQDTMGGSVGQSQSV